MKKKVLSLLLTATFVIGILSPVTVNATTNSLTTVVNEELANSQVSEKSNFIFIKTSDIKDIQYSYEQDGKTYLVKESSNDDLTEISTEIYEVDELANVLVDQFVTTIEKNDDVIIVTQNEDDAITRDIIDIGDGSLASNQIKTFAYKPATGTYTGGLQYDYINHKYYTLWFNAGDVKGSNAIHKFTLTVVIGILSGISGNGFIIGGITSCAQYIVDNAISDVYWTRNYEELWEVTYPGRQYIGSAVGQKVYTYFYEDSARRSKIGSDFYEYHDPVYWPSHMNF